MAKQSPKDPKFRCNICKEYFYASEHPVHYQCPQHGYLCQKHIGIQGQLVYGHDNRNNPNVGWVGDGKKGNPNKNPYFDKIIEIPPNLIGKCLCSDYWTHSDGFFYNYNDNHWAPKNTQTLEYKFEENRCLKTPAKFIWNVNINRWLEEGKEIEEDFLKEIITVKKVNKSSNNEIKLLLDLFEKNILTKEQFIEQVKQKI